LLPVIVFMAAKILPGFSPRMTANSRILAMLMWALFVAAGLRVGGEAIGGYGDGWNIVVAGGGTLGTLAFSVFAVMLWRDTPPTAGAASGQNSEGPQLS